MRNLSLIIVFLFIFFQACTPPANTLQNVNLLIENNSQYCGGAAPSDELLDQLAIYQPSANQTFYIRQGNLNMPFTPIFKTFTTDATGKSTIQLPIGTYSVISSSRYYVEQNPGIDSTCSYLQQTDFNLVVSTIANQTYSKRYTESCTYYCSGEYPQ